MKEDGPLSVQCFVKREVQDTFSGENLPRLLYVSEINPDTSAHPRVMHAHEDYTELVLITSGSSDYLIGSKKRHVQAGDLLIYNPGVVHDDVSSSNNEVGSYCVAVGGLRMPYLPKNALIPKEAGYIFPTYEQFGVIRALMEMMFRSLAAEEAGAEDFCTSLMHALLQKALTLVEAKLGTETEQVEEPSVLGQRIKEYIDEHYNEPITLQSIGEALHISPYYMAHVFKEMSGYSPM